MGKESTRQKYMGVGMRKGFGRDNQTKNRMIYMVKKILSG